MRKSAATLFFIAIAGTAATPTLQQWLNMKQPNPINKPKQQLAVLEHNYEWFTQYIWDEQASPDMAPADMN